MTDKLLYGVAYYIEYMPYDRLQEDIKMMKDANINVVRIAESTWSTYEPQENIFEFSSVKKVIDAMHEAGISVIIGTPTYAIPTWMAKGYPEVMITDKEGKRKYGTRQIFDYTHPTFRYFAERIIRKLVSLTADHPAVIGFQVDNETKHFNTSSENIQIGFIKSLKEKYNGDLELLNKDFGLDYWSNRINSWEDFPNVTSTINASLGAEFEKYQRNLNTDFLTWQAEIVNEYKHEHHFVTNNFDFEWRRMSYGINPDANHFDVSKAMDVTSIDVYHPTQDDLTGIEISICGDFARTTKQKNYIVMETQAQAFKQWTPYPGQLRLQAFSHIASGASTVEYWHWHSIHNSYETYWEGLLSHDLKPNPVYNEAKIIGKEFKNVSKLLNNSRKKNKVAFVVSNESLTGIDWFPYDSKMFDRSNYHQYNDVLRTYYDSLYRLNVEADIIEIGDARMSEYDFLIAPLLYSATDDQLEKLNRYVEKGGIVLYSFKSGFSNENLKVRTTTQPGLISKACGVEYQLFVDPKNVTISGTDILSNINKADVSFWMELLTPTTGNVLAKYDHQFWGDYAAITENEYGKGKAYYVGAFLQEESIVELYKYILKKNNLCTRFQENQFPIITKQLINEKGENFIFIFNYSNKTNIFEIPVSNYEVVIDNKNFLKNKQINPWDFVLIKKNN
ncbi:beta-galactosidase [Vagococcus fluvialis]|uniref:beta-galactosidase n=1 Tax=Vagococcus fluvialis TaxID=2738 RepID=UPI003D125AFF